MKLLSLLPPTMAAAGIFLLFKLKFFFFRHPIRTARTLGRSLSREGAPRALLLSLAGTLGVGNVVGVGFGIIVGGAGSVFWLLVSAAFSAVLKFAESAVAADMREGERGGMMYVIRKSFRGRARLLSYGYALFCLLLALTMGSALQSRAAVESLGAERAGVRLGFAMIFALLVIPAVIGGAKKIERVTAIAVPAASVAYVFLTVFVIVLHADRLGMVIADIFRSAFKTRAVAGGVGTYTALGAIREGFCRGLLSNEAGAGTSAMAQARSSSESAAEVGLSAACEVIADTVVLCMLTALAVLCAVPRPAEYSTGMELIRAALSSAGGFAEPVLCFCISAFAFSTVICWYYYGALSLEFLTGSGKTRGFTAVFVLSVFVGALSPSRLLIELSDVLLFIMCLFSLSAVIKNSDRLLALSEKGGLISKGECGKGELCREPRAQRAARKRRSR